MKYHDPPEAALATGLLDVMNLGNIISIDLDGAAGLDLTPAA